MKCLLCKSEVLSDDSRSSQCTKCGLLLNKDSFEKDYSDGGGQSVPSENKRALRLENSEARFTLLKPFFSKDSLFIDIGCGSGEMLEISKRYNKKHLGFDSNKILIEYCQNIGLNVICDFYNKSYIEDNNSQKVFAASHVIEHMDDPLSFIKDIYSSMKKGDILYIEVPLYTGVLFKRKGYNCNLWIDEHLALYSLDSLKYIANQFTFEILECNNRNFINESKNKLFLFRNFIRNPFAFIFGLLTKNDRQQIADNIFKDYGYIILKKI